MSSLDNNQVMMLLLELRKLGIIDSKILEALTSVNRVDFLPERFKGFSYEDASLEIFKGVETTKILDLGKMILLILKNNKNTKSALEIGTGSGLLTAILSKIYERVYSVEVNKESYFFSKNLLKNISGRIFLRLADGKKGWQEVSPFDAIYIDACAENSVTSLLKNQLSRFGTIDYAKSFSGQQFYCLDKNENDFNTLKSNFKVRRTMLV